MDHIDMIGTLLGKKYDLSFGTGAHPIRISEISTLPILFPQLLDKGLER